MFKSHLKVLSRVMVSKLCLKLLNPLFSTDQTTPVMSHPILGSTAWERHGHTGVGPAMCCKDDGGTGAPDVPEEAKRAGTIPPREEKARRGSFQCAEIPNMGN